MKRLVTAPAGRWTASGKLSPPRFPRRVEGGQGRRGLAGGDDDHPVPLTPRTVTIRDTPRPEITFPETGGQLRRLRRSRGFDAERALSLRGANRPNGRVSEPGCTARPWGSPLLGASRRRRRVHRVVACSPCGKAVPRKATADAHGAGAVLRSSKGRRGPARGGSDPDAPEASSRPVGDRAPSGTVGSGRRRRAHRSATPISDIEDADAAGHDTRLTSGVRKGTWRIPGRPPSSPCGGLSPVRSVLPAAPRTFPRLPGRTPSNVRSPLSPAGPGTTEGRVT